MPINIPAGVTVTLNNGVVTVKGPKRRTFSESWFFYQCKGRRCSSCLGYQRRKRKLNYKQKQAFHGLYRSLVNNMVVGVSEGYKKVLELVGVGYRVSNQGNLIEFSFRLYPPYILFSYLVKLR